MSIVRSHFGTGIGALLVCHLAGCGLFEEEALHLGVWVENVAVETVPGVLVSAVLEPAVAEAGLHQTDIITQLNGKPIAGPADLRRRLGDVEIGSNVQLTVFRPEVGRELDEAITVVLAGSGEPGQLLTSFGLQVTETAEGAIKVIRVDAGSEAATSGLLVDDVVQAVNGNAVRTIQDVWRAVAIAGQGEMLTIRCERAGRQEAFECNVVLGPNADTYFPLPGLFVQDIPAVVAEQFGYATPAAVRITKVLTPSPAKDAGLMVGDTIMSIMPFAESTTPQEQRFSSAGEFSQLIAAHANQKVNLRCIRGATRLCTVPVTLEAVPSERKPLPEVGMSIEVVQHEETSRLFVRSVTAEGPAADAGITVDDTVQEIGSEPVVDMKQFWDALLKEMKDKKPVVVKLMNERGWPRYVTLEPKVVASSNGGTELAAALALAGSEDESDSEAESHDNAARPR